MQKPVEMIFALARGRGLSWVKADVIAFGDQWLELRQGRLMVRRFAYSELRRLTYTDGGRSTDMWQVLGGGLLGKKEARFLISGPEEKVEVALELDAAFRRAELRLLFKRLYKLGVDLHEQTAQGGPAFLFESVFPDERTQRIAELQQS